MRCWLNFLFLLKRQQICGKVYNESSLMLVFPDLIKALLLIILNRLNATYTELLCINLSLDLAQEKKQRQDFYHAKDFLTLFQSKKSALRNFLLKFLSTIFLFITSEQISHKCLSHKIISLKHLHNYILNKGISFA